MLQTLKNAWRTKDIRNKLLFTFLIVLIYRLGTVIPVPFVDAHSFAATFDGTILDYLNVLKCLKHIIPPQSFHLLLQSSP